MSWPQLEYSVSRLMVNRSSVVLYEWNRENPGDNGYRLIFINSSIAEVLKSHVTPRIINYFINNDLFCLDTIKTRMIYFLSTNERAFLASKEGVKPSNIHIVVYHETLVNHLKKLLVLGWLIRF
jgi:hypothetical protein